MIAALLLATLIVAFIAGMVALAMPCCFTVLLPAYVAKSFSSMRGRVGMTFLFGGGIATVMLPIAVGITFISSFIAENHPLLFVVGGLFMIVLGIFTWWGVPMLPMMSLHVNLKRKDAPSVYALGIFSGVASSCCAPVLAGVLVLAVLSGTWLTALFVGLAYVAGMVFPLFVVAMAWDRKLIHMPRVLQSRLINFRMLGTDLSIHSSKLIAGSLFVAMGIFTVTLGLLDRMIGIPGSSLFGIYQTGLENTLLALFSTPAGWAAVVVVGAALVALVTYAIRRSGDRPPRNEERSEPPEHEPREHPDEDTAPSGNLCPAPCDQEAVEPLDGPVGASAYSLKENTIHRVLLTGPPQEEREVDYEVEGVGTHVRSSRKSEGRPELCDEEPHRCDRADHKGRPGGEPQEEGHGQVPRGYRDQPSKERVVGHHVVCDTGPSQRGGAVACGNIMESGEVLRCWEHDENQVEGPDDANPDAKGLYRHPRIGPVEPGPFPGAGRRTLAGTHALGPFSTLKFLVRCHLRLARHSLSVSEGGRHLRQGKMVRTPKLPTTRVCTFKGYTSVNPSWHTTRFRPPRSRSALRPR